MDNAFELPDQHFGPYRDRRAVHNSYAAALLRGQEGATVAPPEPGHPTDRGLVSSFEGPIEEILLMIPQAATMAPIAANATPIAEIFRALIAELPDTALIIVVEPTARSEVERWVAGRDHAQIIAAPDDLHFSFWAEDPFCVRRDGPTFLDPLSFRRYGDPVISSVVAANSRYDARRLPLLFQGGNMLVGDTFVLVGVDEGADSMSAAQMHDALQRRGASLHQSTRAAFQAFLNTSNVFFVGTEQRIPLQQTTRPIRSRKRWYDTKYFGNALRTAQPLVHIDMFITLIGREDPTGPFELMVGDPKLAADILGQSCPEYALASAFDDVAERMRGLGFVVTRNPMPLVSWEKPEKKSVWWAFATANNCLVERTATSRRVLLPTYRRAHPQLEKTERYTRNLWEKRGFRVTELPDCGELAQRLGSVHCIKKYLRRG